VSVAATPPRQRVEIWFASDPPGATVFVAGSPQSLGVTPFSSVFDASTQSATFEFRADGRRVARRDVSLQRDAHIEVALAPEEAGEAAAQKHGAAPPQAGAHTHSKSSNLDHDVMFNPFK